MCDHCGCRAFAPIAELTADHEDILRRAWALAEATRHRAEQKDRMAELATLQRRQGWLLLLVGLLAASVLALEVHRLMG